MQKLRSSAALLALVAALTAAPAAASPFGVVRECGRTAGHAVRNSAVTVGRTIRDFFEHGPHTAKRTWQENAGRTGAEARADRARVEREAHREG
jgi:hypothetical protein